MTMKMKLCNVHKMAFANEGEERKPIHIPFGTWDYDDKITQTLDRPHAEGIANELEKSIAAGEPGIPVYQGHPDVPEYAGKYPDKGALGWVKKIMVNEDGMDLVVEWDRDPGKGFGWFSPYWVGDNPTVGADGKKNVVVDGLTSVGLVNNPNIREFRLANEMPVMGGTGNGERGTEFAMPAHLVALAKRFDERRALPNEANFDESKHPRDNDGKFSSTGGGGATPKGDDGPSRPSQSSQKSQSSVADKFKAAAKKAVKDPAAVKFNDALKAARKAKDGAGIARAHMMALKAGMVWDKSIKGYRPPVAK